MPVAGAAHPLCIGPVRLDGQVLLAPMSGITDVAMRRIARRLGAAGVVSEMIASPELARGSEEARLKLEGQGVLPHIVQIAGRDPGRMAEAARIAESSGADIIDINMGCPAKRVARQLCGSALMREPDLVARVVETVAGAVGVPVTVKMRLGFDATSLNAPDIARRCESAGARLIAVHGRTRAQFYEGRADWAAVAAVKRAIGVPLIVNGDIACAADAQAALRLSGAQGVMIGRAALGRPWLLGEIEQALRGETVIALSATSRRDVAIEHYQGLLALYGVSLGLRHARKHLQAYGEHALSAAVPARAAPIKAALVRSVEPAEVESLLREAFALAAETGEQSLNGESLNGQSLNGQNLAVAA
ncbi:tRNA-U20-dihydrouridine synthase [Rhizobiales bacterium GAS113]|nr:tRNA-U20-dihydrouridine synthase [Rhizobiales bacterium GAS113]